MLDCKDLVQKHASDYIDDNLPFRKKLTIKFHLLICVHCRRFIKQFSLAAKMLCKNNAHTTLSEDKIADLASKLKNSDKHKG